MKKISAFLAIVLASSSIAVSQNIGINATGAAPNASAMLDVDATNQGILIPRVALSATNNTAPVTSPATSLLIYNTATAGSGATAVYPGYYYWDGTQWVRFFTGSGFADNGLYYNTTSQTIRLGGALVENTTITNGAYGFTLNLNGTGDFTVQDNGTNTFLVRDDGVAFFGDDVYWRDGNTGGTNLMVLTDDGNDGRLRIYENGSVSVDLDANTQFVFNEQGLNRDFRVEGNNNTNTFFVDAGNDVVGFQKQPSGPTIISGTVVNEIYYPIEIGNDGGGGYQVGIGYYLGSDPEVIPEADWYGYVGTSTYSWYRMYSYGFINVSSKYKKRDILKIEGDYETYVMEEIEKMPIYFYKYKNENDELNEKEFTKYQPMYHIGALVEESPDFIKDNTFSGIDVYEMASLSLLGVKSNLKEIKKIKTIQQNIQDFGSISISKNGKLFIPFSSEFIKNKIHSIPVVTVTPLSQNVSVTIVEKTNDGFYVEVKGVEENDVVYLDWIAIAKNNLNQSNPENIELPDRIKRNLIVDDAIKQKMQQLFQQTSISNQ